MTRIRKISERYRGIASFALAGILLFLAWQVLSLKHISSPGIFSTDAYPKIRFFFFTMGMAITALLFFALKRKSLGFIRGLTKTSSFLAHPFALGIIAILDLDATITTPFLIAFAVLARFTRDWLFWTKMIPKEIDSEESFKNWWSSVKNFLLSQPGIIKSIFDIVIDCAADVCLVYTAWAASVPPAWIFVALFGCHAVAAAVQKIIVERFDKQKYQLFSMIVTMLAVMTAIGIKNGATPLSYVYLFGLAYFSLSTQILIILSAKTVLTGSSLIAKAIIENHIQVATEQKFGSA